MGNGPQILALTGLNGYVATHVALYFLERGWYIRGSVRTAEQAKNFETHPTWKPWKDRVKVFVVSDTETGDFSALLHGVSAVIHLAAPLLKGSWEETKGPAVRGTINILKQAATVPSIQAVSMISSFAAVYTLGLGKGTTYSEADYSPFKEEELETMDASSNPMAPIFWYCASKVLAERAAVETHKQAGAPWPFSIICPPMVYGPLLHQGSVQTDFSGATRSVIEQYGMIAGKDADLPMTYSSTYIDARDLADVFWRVIDQKKEGRYIAASGDYDWQKVSIVMRKIRPDLDAHIPIGKPDEPSALDHGTYKVDTSKSIRELGITYSKPERTWADLLDYFVKIGAVNA